jgi:hypothetical protein
MPLRFQRQLGKGWVIEGPLMASNQLSKVVGAVTQPGIEGHPLENIDTMGFS